MLSYIVWFYSLISHNNSIRLKFIMKTLVPLFLNCFQFSQRDINTHRNLESKDFACSFSIQLFFSFLYKPQKTWFCKKLILNPYEDRKIDINLPSNEYFFPKSINHDVKHHGINTKPKNDQGKSYSDRTNKDRYFCWVSIFYKNLKVCHCII